MSLLGPLHFSALMSPWALLLLLGVAAVLVAELMAGAPGVLSLSTGATLGQIRGHSRYVARRLPALLRALGLTLLVIALARPITGYQVRKDRANIIDIMLCVDCSQSMLSMDFISGGQRQNRLDVTKEAVRSFLESRKDKSSDQFGLDRIGLICYATYAWTQSPLTLDYGVLEHEIERAAVSQDPGKQATAIGSAIGLAVSRLRKSEAKSKVVILLTDGNSNTGDIDPITAAGLAKEYGIRVYTIGAGSVSGGFLPTPSIFGNMMLRQNSEGIDEATLNKIADTTGGKYYRAKDTESLLKAYKEINQLETTDVELNDYYEHTEGFLPFAVLGALSMLLSVFVRRQWFEIIP